MVVYLITFTGNPASTCARAAAMCVGNDEKPLMHPGALRHAMESGHESVLEHACFTFKICGISRACLAQLTRHRMASFSVLSQRYVAVEDNAYVIPESIKEDETAESIAVNAMSVAYKAYTELLAKGIPKEDARFVLPQAMTTDLIMTMNARELRHFFSLRCCHRAQWEIQDLANAMLELVMNVAPKLFKDAGPNCFRGGCKESRPCGHPWEGVRKA